MFIPRTFVAAMLSLASIHGVAAEESNALSDLQGEAKQRAMALGGQLKAELQAAIKAGGPVNGIQVCREKAPAIAASLSTDGWKVARTSLKYRNPNNAPDEFERKVLEEYLVKLAKGVSPKSLGHGEVQEKEGQRAFRYMQPIMTDAVCLACHGATLAPEVKQALSKYYPDDKATGFEYGQLRGAFSIQKALD